MIRKNILLLGIAVAFSAKSNAQPESFSSFSLFGAAAYIGTSVAIVRARKASLLQLATLWGTAPGLIQSAACVVHNWPSTPPTRPENPQNRAALADFALRHFMP